MAKWTNSDGLDAALSWWADCDVLHLCNSQPANYAALATTSLGSVSLTPGVGDDFSLAAGSPNGRRLNIAAQQIAAATASDPGTSLHVALAKTGDSTLRVVATVPNQPITSGNPAQIGAWSVQIDEVV